ncbi:MAG: hypothetical protein HKN43_16160, partial [Rhodothermales bacterium]|nr:hypothetical protein [Rhodothermales bacterium]
FASFSSGSDDLSRETFTRAIENVDEDKLRIAVYWMALGNISIRAGELERALSELRTARQNDPSNGVVLARLGLLNSMLGDLRLGLEQINLAIAQDPVSPDILHSAARAYYLSGQYEEAREFATTIFEYRSTIDDLELAGDIYFALKYPEDARAFWMQALEIDPDRIDLVEKVQLLAQ